VQRPLDFEKEYNRNLNDAAVFHHPESSDGKFTNDGGYNQVVVFDENQVHIIGDENDLKLAKEFNAKYDAELAALNITLTQTSQSTQEGIKQGVQELFDSNPELANQVYSALGFKQNNTIEDKLKSFFNQFGFQFKEGDSSTDLLQKIIYTSKEDNNVFIDNSVKALSQLLLANTNIDFNKLQDLIEETSEFKNLLKNSSEYVKNTHQYLKDGNRIPMEEWVSYIKEYNKIGEITINGKQTFGNGKKVASYNVATNPTKDKIK
jgi:hypothetical protein